MEFHENLSNGSQVVACGRTDGQMDRLIDRRIVITKASSRFSQFCESAQGEII
jgi:hypothetical protein